LHRFDGFVKSPLGPLSVIPAKAGMSVSRSDVELSHKR
jgi:hypothetical protein